MRPRLRFGQVDRATLTAAVSLAAPASLSDNLGLFRVDDLIEPRNRQPQFLAGILALSAIGQNRQTRETQDFGIRIDIADQWRFGAVRRAAIRQHRAPPPTGS